MLLSLNDDCLFYICKLLNFYDQYSLADTCQHLKFIVETIWHQKYKVVVVDSTRCDLAEKNPDDYLKYMKAVSPTVEDLTFDYIERKHFRVLKEIQFSKVTSLTISNPYDISTDDNYDNITKQIIKRFPNITKFAINSGISGKYLWHLTNLNELDFRGCYRLQAQYFKKTITTLHIKKLIVMHINLRFISKELHSYIGEVSTLEELWSCDTLLLTIIDQLPKLKKLHKLVCGMRDFDTFLLEKIFYQSGSRVDSVIFDKLTKLTNDHFEKVTNMNNMRRFIFNDYNLEREQFELIGRNLGNSLIEFRYMNASNILQDKYSFFELLNNCIKLEILDISNNVLDVDFLRTAVCRIKNCKNRKTPLIIRCFETTITEEDAEMLTIPNVAEIKLTKEEIILPGSWCFQVDWQKSP